VVSGSRVVEKNKKMRERERGKGRGVRILRFFIIIYSNLKEFRQVIVRDHLWNSPD